MALNQNWIYSKKIGGNLKEIKLQKKGGVGIASGVRISNLEEIQFLKLLSSAFFMS